MQTTSPRFETNKLTSLLCSHEEQCSTSFITTKKRNPLKNHQRLIHTWSSPNETNKITNDLHNYIHGLHSFRTPIEVNNIRLNVEKPRDLESFMEIVAWS